jgi:uncharacterized protein YdeI (YjbR/CyaY-like superfamily)
MGFNTKIDNYIASKPEFAQAILVKIREMVHSILPQVEETIKWNSMCFEHKGLVCSCAAFKQHCVFGFWKHELMRAEFPDLGSTDKIMYQIGKMSSVKDVPTKTKMKKWVQYAAMLNEKGIATKRDKKTNAEIVQHQMPEDFDKALRKNKKLLNIFEAMPPSHKKEYITWIADAKREETKNARIEKALNLIAEKQDLNFKYRK